LDWLGVGVLWHITFSQIADGGDLESQMFGLTTKLKKMQEVTIKHENPAIGNVLLPAVHSGEITKNDYLRASCRLLEQGWLRFYSEAQIIYYNQIVEAYETVHPNGR
jgi:hypothetical protein